LLDEGGAAKEMRQLIKRAEKEGWAAEQTKKGHWRLTHPKAAYHVIAPGTPSDYRSVKNTEAELRRAMRTAEAGASSVPVREITDSLIEGLIELC
jgi:predicted RNA binding protein YcfA (HicA-like mRNA interferase family)